MSAFQYIGVTVLGLLVLIVLRGMVRGKVRSVVALLWTLVLGAAAVAMVYPDATTLIAQRVGIQRGVDLILYSFVLVSGFLFLWGYGRIRALNQQVTILVRELALRAPMSSDQGKKEHG